jgi:signal peptidase I
VSAIIIMLATMAAFLVLTGAALALAGRWLKYPRHGFGRVFLVATLWLSLAFISFVLMMSLGDSAGAFGWSLVLFLVTVVLEVSCMCWLLRASLGKALAGWGITLVARGIHLAVALLVVRGLWVEAFRTPTLGMAPTLLSRHAARVCPQCGGTMLYDMDESALKRLNLMPGYSTQPPELEGFCPSCRRTTTALLSSLSPVTADRFLVTKFLKPVRWDVATFRHGKDLLVKRVIGMPGEGLTIDGAGHIAIHGEFLTPPAGVPFLPPGINPESTGNFLKAGEKVILGSDEYFVIGDHAEGSYDSRGFGPVHANEMVGVVTAIYWPPSRARVLR